MLNRHIYSSHFSEFEKISYPEKRATKQLTNEKKKTISKLESQRKEYRKKANRAYHK